VHEGAWGGFFFLLIILFTSYSAYDKPWLIPGRSSWSCVYALALVLSLQSCSPSRLGQVAMAFGLGALLLACLWFHTLPDPPPQSSPLSLSSSSISHSSIRCVSYASILLPTAVDSMKCNTVSILASSNRTSKSCPSILAEISIFLDASVLSTDSRSLLHMRHLNMRWLTLCCLLPHHQHRVSCSFFILKRCMPVTACPDFSCRYRAIADFLESLR
jgi:hypothetical protein